MININFLLYKRDHYLNYNISQLIKLPLEYKNNIIVTLHGSDKTTLYEYHLKLISNDIQTNICIYDLGFNYNLKINKAIYSDCEFSISCDEDCFVPMYSWTQLIDSTHLLTENITCVTANISNGIPTIETFIRNNLLEKYDYYINLFKTVYFQNIWGVDYSSLNGWVDEVDFYERVRNIPHFYRGIHPARITRDIQIELLNDIECNIEKILKPRKPSHFISNKPYMCNNLFLIKTSAWKNSVINFSRDEFDEVSINEYMLANKKPFIILESANTIHPFFNIFNDSVELSNNFYERVMKKYEC